ncbi:Uncharacterised protein [Enterobacter cloacae]|uniref:Uncharacterized protein n=1 Tax=Enterobacter cloacae TaxID=550 RepID=A0A377LPJ1_ENTCL|nr:Uncharacterised protein [Enterobacter cloacae]
MLFIETDIFTEDVKTLLDDDEYHKLQVFLATQPDYGDLIQNTGGAAKDSLAFRRQGKARWSKGYLFSSYPRI